MAKDRSNQTTVREWLHQAGYDDKKMFKEWVIHWIRKGAS
jgi:hypothetical protein